VRVGASAPGSSPSRLNPLRRSGNFSEQLSCGDSAKFGAVSLDSHMPDRASETSDPVSPADPDHLRDWPRRGAGLLGIGSVVGGAIAVFITNNGAGAAALLVAGFAFCLMALTGRPVLVKFPGGGEISPTAKIGTQIETAAMLAVQGNFDGAAQVLDNTFADSLRRRGAENPEAIARAVQGWPELKTLVNRLKDSLNSAGIEYETVSGENVPRLRATVGSTDYGLYVMPGSETKKWWVERAAAATRRLPGDVLPVLMTEVAPNPAVRAAAREANVSVTWLGGDGTLHDTPW